MDLHILVTLKSMESPTALISMNATVDTVLAVSTQDALMSLADSDASVCLDMMEMGKDYF